MPKKKKPLMQDVDSEALRRHLVTIKVELKNRLAARVPASSKSYTLRLIGIQSLLLARKTLLKELKYVKSLSKENSK